MYCNPTFSECPFFGNKLTNIILPGTLKTIRQRAFLGSSLLTEIDLPEGLETIEGVAFASCTRLSNITFPNTLKTIGDSAFQSAAIEGVVIPSEVISIGENPFSLCRQLKNVSVMSNNLNYKTIGGVLYSKEGKRLVLYPNGLESSIYQIPAGVESINGYAFYGDQHLIEVIIPEKVTSIGRYCFYLNTGIRDIYLPKSLTTIGSGTFTECSNLTLYCWDGRPAHIYAQTNGIPFVLRDTPINNPDLKLPSSLNKIEDEAFSGIAAKRVMLAEDVSKIGSLAFANCPNLIAIYIPENCTSIATNAFSGVSGHTIYGYDSNYAEFYANKQGYGFVGVDWD